jgi:hypothetical protein
MTAVIAVSSYWYSVTAPRIFSAIIGLVVIGLEVLGTVRVDFADQSRLVIVGVTSSLPSALVTVTLPLSSQA